MKGFDDHLDNYGDPDPGDDFYYDPDPYAGVPGDVDPDYTDDDEPTVIVEGREYDILASGDAICPECGVNRSTGRIADHMASEHSDDDDDYDDYEENEDANFDVEAYDEAQHDDGITTDDFDHWPGGREFPS